MYEIMVSLNLPRVLGHPSYCNQVKDGKKDILLIFSLSKFFVIAIIHVKLSKKPYKE